MAIYPINDIKAIRDIFADLEPFNPKDKKVDVAKYMKDVNERIAKLNKIFVKYFGD